MLLVSKTETRRCVDYGAHIYRNMRVAMLKNAKSVVDAYFDGDGRFIWAGNMGDIAASRDSMAYARF